MTAAPTAKELADGLGLEGLRSVVDRTPTELVVLGGNVTVTLDGVEHDVPFSSISSALMIARGWTGKRKRVRGR